MKKPQVSRRTASSSKRPGRDAATPASLVPGLIGEVRDLILEARAQVAQVVNAGLTTLYWQIGDRIRREVLKEKRAEYGEAMISALSRQLEPEFGQGFSEKSLRHMLRFAEAFPDIEIVSALRRQLSWTHFKRIIYLDDPLKRDFYAEMCRMERWSTRTLAQKIDGMLYERTVLSKKPDQLIRQELDALREADRLTPDLVFQDPYVLDFLGLKDTYSEADLEASILREIERFLLELGAGFAFVARQKRITVGGDDFHIDLLFYHRTLRRLVLIELKLGKFQPSDTGQVQFYLKWLDRHERQDGEEAPLAIVLCAERNRETVEFLDLGREGIHVAEYLTVLPPKDELASKLHDAVAMARARLENRDGETPRRTRTTRKGKS